MKEIKVLKEEHLLKFEVLDRSESESKSGLLAKYA